MWKDHKKIEKLNKEKSYLEKGLSNFDNLSSQVESYKDLLKLLENEASEEDLLSLKEDISKLFLKLKELETESLLALEADRQDTYLSIHAGAGGVEACDWASMLYRMYLKFCEKKNFKVEVLSLIEGEEAGIKSVTLLIKGVYAYGLLKVEAGVHRLVRISPFDSNARRHTSFASVFCLA